MRITWSIPVRGESLASSRGDLVRARSLIDALRAAGHDVVVVEDASEPSARARVSGYRMVRHALPRRLALQLRDAGRVLHARAHARRVVAAAREQSADLIVETQVHFAHSGARAARATGLPLVVDDCSPWSEEVALGCGAPGLARSTFRAQAKAARVVAVSSRRLFELMLEQGVPSSKLRVVPNAAAGVTDPTQRERMRQRLGFTKSAVVAGFVGSFQPWHRVELAVEALARAPIGVPLHLLLLGEGPGRKEALARAHALGVWDRVRAPGALASGDVAAYLAACDIGLLPGTNAYGQPMKLLEYAAAGLPAVAPDLPPVREVVEHGVTGLLFPPGDAALLARRLTLLAGDEGLRARLGAAARERAAADGAWAARAAVLVEGVLEPPRTRSAG